MSPLPSLITSYYRAFVGNEGAKTKTPPPRTERTPEPPATPVRNRAVSPPWIISPTRQPYSDNLIRCIAISVYTYRAPLTVCSRLQQLISLKDDANGRYTLGTEPKGLRWGSNWDKDDMVLFFEGTPLMMLLIGEVEQAFFVEEDGSPKKYVSLYVRPIRDGDAEKAKALLAGFSTFRGTSHYNPELSLVLTPPVIGTLPNEKKMEGLISANRKQSHRGHGPKERIVSIHFRRHLFLQNQPDSHTAVPLRSRVRRHGPLCLQGSHASSRGEGHRVQGRRDRGGQHQSLPLRSGR